MSSFNAISIDKLFRLIGTSKCPALIDVRTEEDFRADPRLIPGAVRRPFATVSEWTQDFTGRSAVVIFFFGSHSERRFAITHQFHLTQWFQPSGIEWSDASKRYFFEEVA